MNIGIDMDNTICSTSEKILEYQEKFIADKNITVDILWKEENYKNEFLQKYLEEIYDTAEIKNDASKVINILKNNNKIFIITARSKKFVSDIYDVINRYLLKHNINVDGIFIDGKDKVDVCILNKIDVMIDDSRYNYQKLLDNNIKAILFDEHEKNKDIVNRVVCWNDIIDKIKENIC